ncbi:MAG: UDP-glucose/GDP-mannose dehydrogenase family protein [Spirochaetota bacterium]|nr:MAG: UDP-glucose/GDP-mannose dehydrogenase family protein [Spirochaetota bacterium]
MNIAMIGTGYVGLVSGACFSEFVDEVRCVDKDRKWIEDINRGVLPIYEPGLDILVNKNVEKKRLSFTTDLGASVKEADIVFIAVGTPSRRGDGYADLSYVYEAAKEIANNLEGYTVVVNKSTVPVGTARAMKKIIKDTNPDAKFDVSSNPEFLREGSAINDFMRPDRVVIGVESERAKAFMKELYRPLYLIETPMVITTLETAELIKYASNAFLATKISFINEIANLCEACGADVQDVAKGMGLDRRIGPKFLHAGPGFGGSCFPKDMQALIKIYQDNGITARIAEAVLQVNSAQRSRMVQKINDALDGNVHGKTIGILGLTFKPETNDMREAASLAIIPALVEGGAKVRATDPKGIDEAKKLLKGIEYFEDPYTTCKGADAVVILTEWNEYRALDLARLKKSMKGKAFIDLRNVYKFQEVKKLGFSYTGVGIGA